ncbi:hypothetical protein D5085_17285 [Ectothiorhodospiraceae bacterium BW-2]|nr:hypothetical protein D5085_17285 [Ectothiorhodospiraceae bacterium BW-2]
MFWCLRKVSVVGLMVLAVAGCSTRQVVDHYNGSTEQRLISYSLEKMVLSLPEEEFLPLAGKRVYLQSHFIKTGALLDYAQRLIATGLEQRFAIVVTKERAEADIELELFFQSIGTDTDTFGLSLPLVNLSDTSETAQIDILAVNMYHGISECRYYIRDLASGEIVVTNKVLARVRTDKFATPIFSFPLSHLD